jgi:hypothetical protein
MPDPRPKKTATAPRLPAVLRAVGLLSLSGVVAFSTSVYHAGSAEAVRDSRITAVEQKVTTLDENVVPRREHEAHWKAIEESQKSIQTDVREMRETEKQILLKLTK